MGFCAVSLFHLPAEAYGAIQELAMERGCLGIEDYHLDEAQVDALLGERSYSGGDLPEEVLAEVDAFLCASGLRVRFWFEQTNRSLAESFLQQAQAVCPCEYGIEEIVEQDWNAEWKKHYAPISVATDFHIIPEWQRDSLLQGTKLYIHPGMGFGTGGHQTTFLCLKEFHRLTKHGHQFKTVFDHGAGSGILAIAALLANTTSVADLMDIDRAALYNCQQNLELNSIESQRARLLLVEGKPELKSSYELIFANILQNILHEERDFLVSKLHKGSMLILSGLLQHQIAETEEFYLKSGKLRLVAKVTLGDWGVLTLECVV